MDRAANEVEVNVLESRTELNEPTTICELNDLQLALIGGGSGDTILY